MRQSIPLTALAPHVERMHLNENCGFGEEYRVSIFIVGLGLGGGGKNLEWNVPAVLLTQQLV